MSFNTARRALGTGVRHTAFPLTRRGVRRSLQSVRAAEVRRALSSSPSSPSPPSSPAPAPHRAAVACSACGGRGTVHADAPHPHAAPDYRPRRISLIRHGESAGNVNEALYTLVPDNQLPLTDRGVEQAREAGRRLRAAIPDGQRVTFFVSPYVRTRQTYDELAKFFDPDLVVLREEPRLREQDFGNFQNQEQITRCREERREFGPFYYRFPQGESGADVYDRISTFIETMRRQFQSPTCSPYFVLVSHGLTARLFLMRYFQWSVDYFQRTVNLRNCEIVDMVQDEDRRFVLEQALRLKNSPERSQRTWDQLMRQHGARVPGLAPPEASEVAQQGGVGGGGGGGGGAGTRAPGLILPPPPFTASAAPPTRVRHATSALYLGPRW